MHFTHKLSTAYKCQEPQHGRGVTRRHEGIKEPIKKEKDCANKILKRYLQRAESGGEGNNKATYCSLAKSVE